MPSALFYLIMGILQGILEWIPVSSEGQAIFVAKNIFHLDKNVAISLAIWLHLGTLLAVLIYYRNEWPKLLKKEEDTENLLPLLIYSTIGTGVVGVPILILLSDVFGQFLGSLFLLLMAIGLFFTTYMLKMAEKTPIEENNENILNQPNSNFKTLSDLTPREQFIIGLFQGIAIIPGVSRSGTTIGAFLFLKVDKNSALKGSFIISVPAVLGAVGVDILLGFIKGEPLFTSLTILGVIFAVIVAFIFGIATLDALIRLVRKIDFSIVTLLLAIMFLIGFLLQFA